MTDLGLLPNYNLFGTAFGFNDHGQVVGASVDPNLYVTGFIWQNGAMTDLNTLVVPGSTTLQVIIGNDINDRGEIAGVAVDPSAGCPPPQWSNWPCIHAVVMLPCDQAHSYEEGCGEDFRTGLTAAIQATERPKIALPENIREQMFKRLGLSRLVPGMGKKLLENSSNSK